MFEKLTQFEMKRTTKQAFGFYLCYFFIGGIVGGIFSILFKAKGFEQGMNYGAFSALLYNPIISFSVIWKKNLWFQPKSIIIAGISIILSQVGGSLLGVIPAAYLTTLDVQSKPEHTSVNNPDK